MALLRSLLSYNIGSIFIMPEHILRFHLFVGKSFLHVGGYGEEYSVNDTPSEVDEDSDDDEQEGYADPSTSQINMENGSLHHAYSFDRRGTLIIQDHATAGPAGFTAVKTVKPMKLTSDNVVQRGSSR